MGLRISPQFLLRYFLHSVIESIQILTRLRFRLHYEQCGWKGADQVVGVMTSDSRLALCAEVGRLNGLTALRRRAFR